MGKTALVVGGSNGIGLGFTEKLLLQGYEKVYILDKTAPDLPPNDRIEYHPFNLLSDDYSILSAFDGIDTLIITAGFGRVAPFDTFENIEIINGFKVNTTSAMCIILHFISHLQNPNADFTCIILGSIAGLISSPLFAVYGATKAALVKFIESVNIELEMTDSKNRILNVSPGSLQGTRFGGGKNDTTLLQSLIDEIFAKADAKETLFIPDYEKTYKGVLARYHEDPEDFGRNSYTYKIEGGRINPVPQV